MREDAELPVTANPTNVGILMVGTTIDDDRATTLT
jgi:hypothetical protein